MRLRINLNKYCRLCAAGDGYLLDCEEVLFEEESSKTTIKDLVQMNIPEILKDNEAKFLPRRICVQCVRAMLNWGDFLQRSLNSHNYFMKLLSRDFELPKDNIELVRFIKETKNEFSLNLVGYLSRLTSSSRVHFERKTTSLEENEESDKKNLKNDSKKNSIYTSTFSVKRHLFYTSTSPDKGHLTYSSEPLPDKGHSSCSSEPPVKRHKPSNKTFGKRPKKRRKILADKLCKCVMCSTKLPKLQQECDGAQIQEHVSSKQRVPNHQKSPPKTSLDTLQSLNSFSPEKLICSPTIMGGYQEVVDANQPVADDEDESHSLDVDNLVDGSSEWVHCLKENELAYVLESYNLDTVGSFSELQKRLINHLKQIDADQNQMYTSNVQQINDDNCENDTDSDLEATEVQPDLDLDPVVRDHSYAKKPPPGYFRIEEELFRPRNNGQINMQFFIGMSSFWTEDLLRKMGSGEIMCILEICNIEAKGSTTALRNKLIRYLNYIKGESIARTEDSMIADNKDTEPTLTASTTFAGSPGDQSDESPFKGFQSTNISGNPSDQSDESPFKGFQSTHTGNDSSGNPSDQSDESPFKGFQSTYIRNAAPIQTTNCQINIDSCFYTDHVVNNIKTEIDTSDYTDYPIDYTEYQDMECAIKEEPRSPQANTMWMNNDPPSHYNARDLSTMNHYINSELTEYFRSCNIKEDMNKYKCCVVVEKLHPAIISFHCSPDKCFSSFSSASSDSNSTLTCPSPYMSPCSPPRWTPYCHPVSPPPMIENDNIKKISVRKFEDLC